MVNLQRQVRLPPQGSARAQTLTASRKKRSTRLTPAILNKYRQNYEIKGHTSADLIPEVQKVSILSKESEAAEEEENMETVTPLDNQGIGLVYSPDDVGEESLRYIPVTHVQMYEYKDLSPINRRYHYSSVESSNVFSQYYRSMALGQKGRVDEHTLSTEQAKKSKAGANKQLSA